MDDINKFAVSLKGMTLDNAKLKCRSANVRIIHLSVDGMQIEIVESHDPYRVGVETINNIVTNVHVG